jgi:hypothetical protein
VDRLNESMQKIGQAVYAGSTPGADGGGQTGEQARPQEEGTVEGEFREV